MTLMEWIGCVFGLAGSILLAVNTSHSRYAFLVFMVSSLAWLVYAYQIHSIGLLVMQSAFILCNFVGIWRWIVQDAQAA